MTFTPQSYQRATHYYDWAIALGIVGLVLTGLIPFYMFSLCILTPYVCLRLFVNPREYRVLLLDDNNPSNTLSSSITSGSTKVEYYNDAQRAIERLNKCKPNEFPDHIIVDLKYQEELLKSFIHYYNHDLREKYPKTKIHLKSNLEEAPRNSE